MRRERFIFLIGGLTLLLALAGCGRGFMTEQRAPWRHQAEAQCMQSGAVKFGAGVVQIKPIEGPGMCGADFPLKVSALGDSGGARMSYSEAPRPPGGIANSPQMPAFPRQTQYFDPAPLREATPPQMRWAPGAPAIGAPQTISPRDEAAPDYKRAPAGEPVSLDAPATRRPSDIPDDAVMPAGRYDMPRRSQPGYEAHAYEPPRREPEAGGYTPPPLGPPGGSFSVGAIPPAELKPAATLACPLVSALERWVTDGVQPAALHWFRSPVVEMRQISAYSCRGMNGAGGHGISEHAFGNALDVAAFTLADGRKITVKDGWHGTPEEQGFLHDVQLYACETFVTVLGPGYNAAHYNHLHLDLMRRKPGYRPCRPTAVRGEIVAASARAVYASRHGGYTGSIGDKLSPKKRDAIAGADGLDDDDDAMATTGSIVKKTATVSGDADEDTTGSIAAPASSGWPRLIPGSAGAIH
jgi:hypothetical protein